MNKKINSFIQKYKQLLPKEAVEELESINLEYQYLNEVFNHSQWTISILDSEGKYLKVNPKMSSIVGDITGSKIGELSKDSSLTELFNEVKSKNLSSSFKIIETTLNNKKQHFFLTINKIGDRYLLMGSDVTEIQNLKNQQEFNERMSMLGEMSSFIVHEINNPLSVISLSADFIENFPQNEKVQSKAESITKMVEVISKIIKSLKSFSRKNNESHELSMNDILEQALVLVGPKLKKSRTILTKEISDDSVYGVDIDFLQVLVNLISNSIDAIQNFEDGKKWIKVIWKDQKLSVIDSGSGIPLALENRLFEKFHTTKGSNGNGIGLYLSKQILERNGFDLQYKKTDEGNTSFVWNKVS